MACCALLLAGCATTPGQMTAPSVPATGAPPAVEVQPAQVRGHEEPSTMLDSFTVHIAAVDGVPVAGGREGWNTPVALKPGLRRLALVFTRGVFTAQAEVSFVAASGASYRAHFATDAQLFGRNSFCEFWVVDTATNEPVSARLRMPLTRNEPAPAK